MLSSKIKDLKLRKLFFKFEKKKKICKFLFINLLSRKSASSHNKGAVLLLLKLQNQFNRASKIRLTNRCVLSNRGKGVNKLFGLSRIIMRDLIQFGIIPGYTKAVW
jgi:small subunit ribosomal protein S14